MHTTKHRLYQASITVFLTLILLLVTALLCTTVEAARIQGARSFGKVVLNASIDSIYSSYQRELYDNYRIFGYERAESFDESMESQIEGEIVQLINEMLDKSISNINQDVYHQVSNIVKATDWYRLQLENVKVTDVVTLTDYKGNIFLNQVLEFMKYSAPVELVTKLLECFKLYNSNTEVTNVMNSKLKAQEAVSGICKDMLKLMEKVEGVRTDKNGICLTKSNTVRVNNSFCKKIITEHPTMETLRINNSTIYNALKKNYLNVMEQIELVISSSKEAIECNNKIEKLTKQKEALESSIAQLEQSIEQLARERAAREEDEQQNNDRGESNSENESSSAEKLLEELNQSLHELEEKIKENKDTKEHKITLCKECNLNIASGITNTIQCIEESYEIINSIELKSKKVASQVNSYEDMVNKNKDKLGEDTYKEFRGNVTDLKGYIGLQENKNELTAASAVEMRKPLQRNQKILESVYNYNQISIKSDNETLQKVIVTYEQASKELKEYSVKELRFDYSSLTLSKESDSPVDVLLGLLDKGILDLVIKDSGQISKAIVDTTKYPSKIALIKEDNDINCSSILEECKDNEYSSKITDTFRMDHSVGNEIANSVLLNQYQVDFFNNYVEVSKQLQTPLSDDKEIEEEQKNKVLQYEKEYMLVGKNSDEKNLANVVTRIIILRSVFNFLYLFTDKEKTALAYTTAAGIVGFTCLEPLIELVKILILYIWSLEESIVDANALLSGYKVPIIKTKNNFKIQYTDLLTLNKSRIQCLADQYKSNNIGFGLFSYSEYLRIFLLIHNSIEKNCYRTMDMIQMNMQDRVNSDFKLGNCVFGVHTVAKFHIPEMMVVLPFVKKILGNTDGAYTYCIEQSGVY